MVKGVFGKILMAVLFMFMSVSLVFAGGVELSDGVESGMEVHEVKDVIHLEHQSNDRGISIYQRIMDGEGSNAYYFFNEETGELVYKVLFLDDAEKEEKIEGLKEQAHTERTEGAYFFSKEGSDLGFKIMDNEHDDGRFQMWIGSISLWNELVEDDNTGLNEFER